MYCKNCGKEISDDAKFCDGCGTPMNGTVSDNQPPPPQGIPPQGQYYQMPPQPMGKKKSGAGKGCLFVVLAVVCVMLIGILASPSGDNARSSDRTNDVEEVEAEIVEEVYTLYDIENINEEQVQVIEELLNKCGVYDIQNVVYFDDLFDDEQGWIYELTTEHGPLMLCLYGDHVVMEINVKQRDKQLYADGEIKNVLMTAAEQVIYKTATELTIKESLVSPNSAKFPGNSEWGIWKEADGKIYVQSYVDSKNAFNAEVRTRFQFTFLDEVLVSIIIDGEEQMK